MGVEVISGERCACGSGVGIFFFFFNLSGVRSNGSSVLVRRVRLKVNTEINSVEQPFCWLN